MTQNWVGRTAVDIAAAVRGGEVTAVEVLEQHLEHIERVDRRVGAFEVVDASLARAAAKAVDEREDRGSLPLAGVPLAVKDLHDVAGMPTRHGSAASPAHPQAEDDVLVARLRTAGAVPVGKTRMPELGLSTVSDNAFGAALNPWDLARTPAGSSGGSGAALASAQVPIATGSDGGGSIRLPSAACGTFGIKPGSGTLPVRDTHPLAGWGGLSQSGPMATTVADVVVMFEVMADRAVDTSPVEGLRVAVSTEANTPLGSVTAEPDCHRAWERAVATLRSQGHDVVEATPDYPSYLGAQLAARSFQGSARDAADWRHELLGTRTRTVMRLAKWTSRVLPVDDGRREDWKRIADAFFERHDVLVTPATGRTAIEHRNWHDRGLLRMVGPAQQFAAFTGPWNLADLPGASVPMGFASDGLPVGVQIVGGRGREDLVLGLAAALEELHPWPRHAPGWLS